MLDSRIEQNQKRNIKLVSQAAKELRYAGYKARADHGMVKVIVSDISDIELQNLAKLYSVSLTAR